MDFQEDLVRLDLDCAPSSFETIPSRKGSHSRVGVPKDALVYFRQEPGRKKKFLVRKNKLIFHRDFLKYSSISGFDASSQSSSICRARAPLELPGNIRESHSGVSKTYLVID